MIGRCTATFQTPPSIATAAAVAFPESGAGGIETAWTGARLASAIVARAPRRKTVSERGQLV